MHCRSCGGSLFGDELACSSCGVEVERTKPAVSAAAEPMQSPTAKSAPPAPAANELAIDPNATRCPVHPTLPAAGTCPRCGTFVCVKCTPSLLYANPQPTPCAACVEREGVTETPGIGGWLVLPAIGLVLSPFQTVMYLYGDFYTQLVNGTFAATRDAVPGYAAVFAFEAFFNLFFLGFVIYVAIQFFSRKRQAPRLMIFTYAAQVVFVLLDHAMVASLGHGFETGGGAAAIVGPIVRGAVWVPYFLMSDRVRKTFVR